MSRHPNSAERARAAVALIAAAVLLAIAVVTLTQLPEARTTAREPTPTLAICSIGYNYETHQCSNDMPTGVWVLPPAPSPWP